MITDSYGNRRFFGIYRGLVFDNADPLGKGRLRLKVPQVLFEAISDWAWAKDAHGVHVDPPVIGQGVWVQFEGGDPSFPVWVGTFGDNPVNLDIDGVALSFDNLTDVTITSPTSRQVPVYNATTGIWENSSVAIPAGGDAGQVLAKASNSDYLVSWVSGTSVPTSTVKHIVRNDHTSTLPKGTVVYTSGANGINILVKPAIGTADQSSAQVVGFLEVDLAPNQDGYAISEGLLGDINTSAAGAEGDPIWLSGTVAGGVVYGFANEPYAPTHLVYLGVVTRKNPVNGQIFIRISNGWELNELHNVNINHDVVLNNKDILQYDSGTLLWKNASLGSNSLYVGTTQIALNRASASQSLTGITSIDGSAGTLTTSRTLWGQSFNGSADVTGNLTSVGDITGSGAVTITAGGTNTSITLAPNGTGTVSFSNKDISSVGSVTATGTVSATTFSGALSGTATNATNFGVTNDVATSSSVYPVWVTANTGNLPGKVSSTALSFVPSTGTLTTTTFSGALSGTATRATNIAGGNSTTLLGAIPYQSGTDTTTLLSPNTTTTKSFLRQTGTGTNGAAPAWDTLVASDIPASLSSTTSVNGTTIPANTTIPLSQNYVLNGAFDIWQRATTGTPTSSATRFVADRWESFRTTYGTGLTVSRQTTNDATNLPQIQYAARVQRTAANTSTSIIYHCQAFETFNSIPLAGKTVTLSFYARAGANYSSASSALSVSVRTGTGTDQPLGAATPIGAFATGAASPISQTATLTTTWQRFSYTGTIATTATQVGVRFNYTPVGTAGTNDYFEVTGVQLEEGSVSTAFRRNSVTYHAELTACQRFYVTGGVSSGYVTSGSTGGFRFTDSLPVAMRTTPTMANLTFTNVDNAANGGHTAVNNRQVHTNAGIVNGAFAYLNGSWTYSASAEM